MSVLNRAFPGWDETPDAPLSLLLSETYRGGSYEAAFEAAMRDWQFPDLYLQGDL